MFLKGYPKFLCLELVISTCIILREKLIKIGFKEASLRRQRLDYILYTQIESLSLNKFRCDHLQELGLADRAFVASIEVPRQVVNLSGHEIRLHLFEHADELRVQQFLSLGIILGMLVEEELRVNSLMHQLSAHLLEEKLRIDASKLIYEFIEIDATGAVLVDLAEDGVHLLIIQANHHTSHLKFEFGERQGFIGIGVDQREDHTEIHISLHNEVLNLGLG